MHCPELHKLSMIIKRVIRINVTKKIVQAIITYLL